MKRAQRRAVRGAPSAVPCACAVLYILLLCDTYAIVPSADEPTQRASRHQGSSRQLAQLTNPTEQLRAEVFTPDAGRVLEGQYVVVFTEAAGDATAAADALVQRLHASMQAAAAAAAAASTAAAAAPEAATQQLHQEAAGQGMSGDAVQAAAASSDQSIRVLQTLGSSRLPRLQAFFEVPSDTTSDNSSSSSNVSANSSGNTTSDSGTAAEGLQAAVLAAPAAALDLIRQTGLVKAVFRDRIIVPQNQVLGSSSSSSGGSRKCVDRAQLQAGVSRSASLKLQWPGCRTGTEKLVWMGSSCSRNAAVALTSNSATAGMDSAAAAAAAADADAAGNSVMYTAVKAVDAATGEQLVSSNGTPCIAYASGLSRGRTSQWFGSCGQAPRFAPFLPTVICSSDSSSSSSQTSTNAGIATAAAGDPQQQQQQQESGQQRQAAADQQQTTGDPQQQQQQPPPDLAYDQPYDNQYYDYNELQPLPQDDSSTRGAFDQPAHGAVVKPTAGGLVKPYTTTTSPTINPSSPSPARRRRRRREIIGDNRVAPPAPVSPGSDLNSNLNPDLPAVSPAAGLLGREALAAGEQVPSGVAFIEGATANAVPVTGGPTTDKAQQVTVAVCDSGVDSTHPDLAYAGGQTWVREPSDSKPGDMVDAGVDFYGHGTHVAGIIGARNNGAGVVGVAPSVPIYSLKVLDGSGQGALSDALDAVKWAAGKEGQALNIKVINLSIASYVSSQADDYRDTLQVVCQIFQEASDAGVLVVSSAGNYQESLLNYLPAACPTVAAVTSIDPSTSAPSVYSNFLPADVSDAAKARVIAAPGNGVLSTISIQRESTRYRELSGTSQAAPHVAGIAATCILSGACPSNSTGLQKLAVLQAAARERLSQQQPYGFAGDPATPKGLASQRYYGFLAWSKFWQR